MNDENRNADGCWPETRPKSSLAVLCSGGVDSAVLLTDALMHSQTVQPLYVRVGSVWEEVELCYLGRLLHVIRAPTLRPLVILDQPAADLYGGHWSLTGEGIPGEKSADDAVYLPGRNVLLLAKSLLWCHLNGVREIALATLAGNPFPDATPAFFDEYAAAVNRAVGGSVRVLTPYAALTKAEVIRRISDFPFQHTFSCLQPFCGNHCGRCNKCAERRSAFQTAGVPDPTLYSDTRS